MKINFYTIAAGICLILCNHASINAMDLNQCENNCNTLQSVKTLDNCNEYITETGDENNSTNVSNCSENYVIPSNKNLELCNKIFTWIGYILCSNRALEQESKCGPLYLTQAAHAVAEQLHLAANCLLEDEPYSESFHEHAKVFNMLLDALNKQANENKITSDKEESEQLKIVLSHLKPIEIKK